MTEIALPDDGTTLRIRTDVGPQASIDSIEGVLKWLSSVEDIIRRGASEAGYEDLIAHVVAQAGIDPPAGPIKLLWVNRLTFVNPLEVLLGGPLCFLVYKVLVFIRDYRGEQFKANLTKTLWESLSPADQSDFAKRAFEARVGHAASALAAPPSDFQAELIGPDGTALSVDLPETLADPDPRGRPSRRPEELGPRPIRLRRPKPDEPDHQPAANREDSPSGKPNLPPDVGNDRSGMRPEPKAPTDPSPIGARDDYGLHEDRPSLASGGEQKPPRSADAGRPRKSPADRPSRDPREEL